jgi:hypothetical protein
MIIKTEVVLNYINTNGLNTPSRHREHVYKRAILMTFLRDRGLRLTEIGRMFNRDHATVLHGVKIYEAQKSYEDFQAMEYFMQSDLSQMVDTDSISKLATPEHGLTEFEFLILGCKNMRQVKKIQKAISNKLTK